MSWEDGEHVGVRHGTPMAGWHSHWGYPQLVGLQRKNGSLLETWMVYVISIYVYMETPIKMDGATPILGNLHVAILKGSMSHIKSSPSAGQTPRDPHEHSIRFVDDRKSHLIQPSDGHGEATKMVFV